MENGVIGHLRDNSPNQFPYEKRLYYLCTEPLPRAME
jgi:hypothetical protein